jgi:hypothetical protein
MLSFKHSCQIKALFTFYANTVSSRALEQYMTDDSWLSPPKGPSGNEIAFDYIKAPDFKVVWADGIIGSVTPNGLIHFAPFSERYAIPRRQVFTLIAEGNVGKLGTENVEKQIGRGSIVRDMSCDVMMSVETAENMANWLMEQIKTIRDRGDTNA